MSKQDPNDLMNKLEVDARASGGLQKDDRDLEVRMTPQARRAKIDAVLKLLAQLGVTKGHAAKAIGKSAAVTQVLNDRYGANPGPILRQLHRKLRDLQQIQEGPGHGEFVTTAVAREVFIVVKNVIKLGTIGVMWGPAGVGKSLALRASAQQRPDSIYVEVMSHWTAAGLAEHLAHAMGVPVSGPLNTSRTVHRILQALRRFRVAQSFSGAKTARWASHAACTMHARSTRSVPSSGRPVRRYEEDWVCFRRSESGSGRTRRAGSPSCGSSPRSCPSDEATNDNRARRASRKSRHEKTAVVTADPMALVVQCLWA